MHRAFRRPTMPPGPARRRKRRVPSVCRRDFAWRSSPASRSSPRHRRYAGTLTASDGDGRMDKADVWAKDMPPAYGLVAARGGIIVTAAPDIIYFADRDGDGTAEVREVLFTGFKTGALERGINAPVWFVDGWIYAGRGHGGGSISGPHLSTPVSLPDSDFRFRADGTQIEPITGATHTLGFAM